MDIAAVKQFVKDADDVTAQALYAWMTAAMEVRGLVEIAGAVPTRKRRADAGRSRKNHDPQNMTGARPAFTFETMWDAKNAAVGE